MKNDQPPPLSSYTSNFISTTIYASNSTTTIFATDDEETSNLPCDLGLDTAELPVMMALALVVNIIAYMVLWRMRNACDSVDLLLVSILNLNDLLTIAVYSVTFVVGVSSCGRLLFYDGVCSVFGWLGSSLVMWSAFIVLIMASLRCLSLVKPFYYRNHVTPVKVSIVTGATFGCCLLLFVGPFTNNVKSFRVYKKQYICGMDFTPGGRGVWHRIFIGTLGALGLASVLYVLVCNTLIIYTLRQKSMVHTTTSSSTSGHTPSVVPSNNAVSKRRVFQRVTLTVSIVYVLTYGPFVMRLLVDTAYNQGEKDDTVHGFTLSLLFLSPLLNPCLYCLFNTGFRSTLMDMARCCLCRPCCRKAIAGTSSHDSQSQT